MLQNNILSVEAKNIVDNFIAKYKDTDAISVTDKMKFVIITLYSQVKNAKSELLEHFKDCIVDLHDFFTQEEIDILMAECDKVIMYCYEQSDKLMLYAPTFRNFFNTDVRQDKDFNINRIPKSLITLCTKLSGERKKNERVYLPYSEIADYALYNPIAEYRVENNESDINFYSQLLLHSQGVKYEVSYNNSEWNNNKDYLETSPDYVFVCNPSCFIMAEDFEYNTSFWWSLFYWLRSIKEGGCIDCIIPIEYLQRSNFYFVYDMVREKLNFKLTIINFQVLFKHQGVFGDTLLLHFEKKTDETKDIRLIDATAPEFYQEGDINVSSIMELLNQAECNHNYEVRLDFTELEDSKDTFMPKMYTLTHKLSQLDKKGKFISLRELVKILPVEEIDSLEISYLDNGMPILSKELLSSNYLYCDFDTRGLSPSAIDDCYISIKEDCLVASNGDTGFKIGRLSGINNQSEIRPICLKSGITPFKLDSNIVTEDYLLKELTCEYCAMQYNIYKECCYFNEDAFLKIKIAVPSLEEQERLCKEDARKYLNEADTKLLQSADEFKRDVHMKKHAIGQTLFNLSNWWDLLQKARKDGNGIVDDSQEIGRIHKTQVSNIYSNIQMAMEKLQMQVDSFWRADGLKAENMSLTTFVKEYIKEHQSTLFVYEYDLNAVDVYNNVPNVMFSKQALTMVFDNIINNACSHGFENKASENNIVKIEVQMNNGLPYILISNNGKPIHEKISLEDVFTYGRSSKSGQAHYGIGGYEVRNLMREFHGEAEFISTPQENFPVSYKLTFKETRNIFEL